jgi:uncharacterized protein YegL
MPKHFRLGCFPPLEPPPLVFPMALLDPNLAGHVDGALATSALSCVQPRHGLTYSRRILNDRKRACGDAMTEQITFGVDEFVSNPEPRCPCVLLLDVSGSMNGKPIETLNQGLVQFRDELAADTLASKRVEVAIVTFGPVSVELPFTGAATFYPPTLRAQGDTPMGAAISQAVALVRDRKSEYRANGIAFYRPWIFLITDGSPTDSWSSAAEEVRLGEDAKQFAFFPIGVQGADLGTLRRISVREPLSLEGLRFRELFSWLSASLKSVSRSTLGSEVRLDPPKGWAAV